jgi:uncharacterized repeat protein (TIGR01451 family)
MTKTRGFGIAAIVLLVFAQLLAGAVAVSGPSGGADIIFLSSKIDPVAASPGGSLDFNVVAQNWGLAPAQNVTMRIVLPDDLTLKDASMTAQNIGPLCSFCNVETKYSMKVSDRAISGDYTIKVIADWGTGTRDKDFTVSVVGTPKLVVTNVNYVPAEIEPGKTVTVTMSVKNIGSNAALNGAVGISLPVLTGDTKSRFSVIGSGTEIPVGTLGVGESATISFILAVDDNVEAGVYNFPLTLSYSGTTATSGVGIVVISKALLTLPKVQTDPVTVTPDKSFLLSATVENTGKNEAKSVVVNVVSTDSQLSGATSSYLGTIKAGDKDVALFEMTYKGPVLQRKKAPVAFNVTYNDDFGSHSFTEKGEITVEASLSGKGGVSPITIGIVVAVIAGAVWFFFFRKRKDNKNKRV